MAGNPLHFFDHSKATGALILIMNKDNQAFDIDTFNIDTFNIVKAFENKGHHRTGTDADRATVDWLSRMLAAKGANVTCPEFTYSHYEATVEITIDGAPINAMALYYSFCGTREISNPAFGEINGHDDEEKIADDINHAVSMARHKGQDGLILATHCPTESLCGINRHHSMQLDFPVILIGKRDLVQVRQNKARISFSATLKENTARNVIGRFKGPDGAARLALTTPFSGWFQCAGERGCGLAIALGVAQKLASECHIDLMLASGHELGFIGGYAMAEHHDSIPDGIIHIGSSLANIDARVKAICSAQPDHLEQIVPLLQRLGVETCPPQKASDPDEWIGESMCWASKNLPMLSVAGISPHFHTELDRAEHVTTPALLNDAVEAIYQAALVMVSR